MRSRVEFLSHCCNSRWRESQPDLHQWCSVNQKQNRTSCLGSCRPGLFMMRVNICIQLWLLLQSQIGDENMLNIKIQTLTSCQLSGQISLRPQATCKSPDLIWFVCEEEHWLWTSTARHVPVAQQKEWVGRGETHIGSRSTHHLYSMRPCGTLFTAEDY